MGIQASVPPPSESPSRLPSRLKKGKKNIWLLIGLGGTLLVLLCVALYFWLLGGRAPFNGPTWTVRKEKLVLTIVERGSLESADNKEFVCRVKAKSQSGVATTIKWLVDDGTYVKGGEPWSSIYTSTLGILASPAASPLQAAAALRPERRRGDKLIELDDSALQENLKEKNIDVDNARAAFIKAEEDYKIQLIDNENDIQKAYNNYVIARLNLEKYIGRTWQDDPLALAGAVALMSSGWQTRPMQGAGFLLACIQPDGDYQGKLQDTLGKVELARGDRDSWLERASWSRRMWKLGFMSKTQADADQSRQESADYSLTKLETDLRGLEIEKKVTETDLRSKVAIAYRDWIKAKLGAEANKATKDSDRKSKKSVLDQRVGQQQDIIEEIGKCKMYATQDGLAIYYIPESTRGGFGKQALVAVGENVSEGQKLIQIPDLNKMLVNTRVHEAMVSHVETGQKAQIRVDAKAGKVLKGMVTQVKNTPSAQDWLSSDVKLYQTMVTIEDNLEDLNLKPGMSSEVTIFAYESPEEVLQIPIESVVGTILMGQKRKCFVIGADGQPQIRDIVVGKNNDKVVQVSEGLKEGEKVVINPIPLLVGEFGKLKAGVPQGKHHGEGGGPEGAQGKKPGKKPGAFKGPKKNGGGGGQEEWKKKIQEFEKKFRAASPAERKVLLQSIPEEFREMTRKRYRDQGLKIDD
jgi:multidrug resistance efflux pump